MKGTLVPHLIRTFILLLIGAVLFSFTAFRIGKPVPIPKPVQDIFLKHGCSSCHMAQHRHVGPSFYSISQRKYSIDQMLDLIHNPRPENWPGFTKMTPIPEITKEEVVLLKNWMDTLKPTE